MITFIIFDILANLERYTFCAIDYTYDLLMFLIIQLGHACLDFQVIILFIKQRN